MPETAAIRFACLFEIFMIRLLDFVIQDHLIHQFISVPLEKKEEAIMGDKSPKDKEKRKKKKAQKTVAA